MQGTRIPECKIKIVYLYKNAFKKGKLPQTNQYGLLETLYYTFMYKITEKSQPQVFTMTSLAVGWV